MECDSKRIEKVYIYKPKLAAGIGRRRIRLYHVVFLLLYFYQIIWVVSTIGEPYREFLEKADREGFQVMEGQTKMRAELQHSLDDINDPNRYTKKIGWMDWMEMDIEEHADRKRREKERNVLDSLPKHMRVPSRYATTFFPSLLLGILVTIHSLVLLLQHWSVSFNTWINFQSVDAETVRLSEEMIELNPEEKTKIDPGKNVDLSLRSVPPYLPTHARIVPAKGRHILVPIVYFPSLGMTFEYHRRRYVFDTDSSLWIKIRCRTNIPLNFFGKWKGFVSDEQTLGALLRYGPNAFQIRQPTFSKMYKAQLLSPFTVFQLFCVILWMLDDYWQYSAFTLFMILTFEATVVFSRLKSLQALRGMGNKTRPVWVYRIGRWIQVDSTELLPGDFLSLTRIKPRFAKNDKENKKRSIIEDEGGDITPADLLILRGSTVVNEASLTGESVPQMKEGLQESMEEEELSMKTTHKSHIVYAGTKLLLCSGESDEQNYALVPKAPDGGALTFVLRTGFSSAQGKLVRMIEGSQEKVKGHERETGLLLLLLFFFAVASSSYVLYHGLQNDKRSQYELLLHCILIITSVIPPELPMQMAMAVNNSLMTLMRMQIFCTEPFRVPIAGKLDSCLFDKTGTLTTDELVAVGVCEPAALTRKMSGTEDTSILTVMSKVGEEAALVLAGCHSLVFIDNETTGDPLESAALKSMRWTLSPSKATVKPAGGTEKEEGGKPLKIKNEITISEIEILTRHHFSSKLQSMSCVIRSVNSQNSFAVAKGSSEAIGKMLVNKPEGYDEKAKYLAKEGYRVIALAYKELDLGVQIEGSKESRVICEADLSFAGFIAFTCRVRKDTKSVLKRLREGGMSIAMVTGDAILTAIHVSKEVGICTPISGEDEEDLVKGVEEEANEELRTLLAQKRGVRSEKKKNPKHFRPILILEQSNGIMYWQNYDDDSRIAEYHANSLPNLSKEYDLATTGKMLAAAFEFDENTRSVLEHIKIFARMTPDAKETVIECLHSVGRLCLMCGDGANDVGALKQADVGVALLSGFGDLNVDRGEDSHKKKKARKDNIPTAIISQEHLAAIRALPIPLLKMKIRSIGVDPSKYPDLIEKEDLVKLYQIKSREIAVKRHNEKNSNTAKKMSRAELQEKARADATEKQQKVTARAAELEAKGEKWATFKAMREFYSHEVEESKKKKRAHGTIEGSASVLAAQFEEVESGELPMVKIGDASVAAPFTSKMPSIQSCVDIVRQGCWKLKAKMEQNDTQTKPSGQVDYDERLKAKMMGENIRSSNTDNDFNKMGNQRPTQLGATAQPGAVAGTLDNAFERRLKAKLQEREQPSNPKTSSKADEYDKRIKAKLQENEQARKPKTTKRVDDYDRRLKAKMQQNEEALRTNKGIDASRSKINERVDYDTKLKEKMMKENRNSSVLDKNYDEMGKHQPDPADNYYESKFESLANKNNDRSRDDEEYFSRLNRKVQENENAVGLNSSDQNNDEMDPVSKNTEFDYDYEEDYQNTSADVGNTYDMEMEAQVQNQTVMVGDHGRAVAPEPQYGQTPGAPVVGGIAGDDQLAVAIAIEEEEDEYYQSATIYDPAAKPPFLKNRRFRLYAGSGLCVCLAMTALIITSIILFREQLVPPVPEIDLDRGAIWEAQMKEDNIDIEKWFIQFESAVPSASNTMSIAHRAARWIISEDPMKLNSYAGNLIQRYLLALFYFTTTNDGERPWRSCNKPKSDENSTCIHERFSRVANDTITYEPDDAIRWMSEEHECNWVGNICDDNLKLRALHVMAQNITGTIPEDLVNLSLLQSLRLAYNNFTGPLPIVYASMRQLLSLEVHGNNLTGTLPSEYFSATLLQTLNIIDNKFTGTISNDIGKLENLKGLHLADNYFTGTIPSDIFKLEYLAFLQLQENIFHGTIPTEIGNMLQLQEFRCEANQLTGPLPSEIGLMNNLVDFRASLNKMTGTLPNELYTNSYLGRLELYSNYFSGTLDPRISQLKELTYLYLSRNQFTGNMTSLESLYRLKLAWLHLNQFEGSLPEKMCDKSQRQIEILQTDCFPLKTPPNACPCCSACCDRSTEICLIMDDDLKYNFF